jgi:hypothetical protein
MHSKLRRSRDVSQNDLGLSSYALFMKRAIVIVALCASALVPALAWAQQGPPPGPPGPMGADGRPSPSPAMRAAMEQARAGAKAAAFAALTPAHATGVQAILQQASAGTLDRRAAAQQIDALLTPDERAAVLAAGDKARRDMRAAMRGSDVPPPPAGGPPPAAGAPPGPPPDGRGTFGPPTAGRLLLMLSLAPPGRRSMMPLARSSSAP